MEQLSSLQETLTRIENRIDALDQKVDTIARGRTKSMEWIATLAQHIESLDDFREEVRAMFEPVIGKLNNLDEVIRIMRHATSDVSRRIEWLEQESRRKVG